MHEDEDNHAVIQSARESLKLIQNKFLPAVRSWVQVRSACARVLGQSQGPMGCAGVMLQRGGEDCAILGPGDVSHARVCRDDAGRGDWWGRTVCSMGCAGVSWGVGEGALAHPSDAPPRWQLFTRAGIHGGHLEAAIDLKAELETTLQRSEELDIKPEEGRRREVSAATGLGRG